MNTLRTQRQKIHIPDIEFFDGFPPHIWRNVTVNTHLACGTAHAYGFNLHVETTAESDWQVYAYRSQVPGSTLVLVPVHER